MLKNTIAIIILSILLSACSISSIGALSALSSISNDRRSAGTVIDDETLSFFLSSWASENPVTQGGHINFLVYNHTVLITGEVPDQQTKQKVETSILKKRNDIVLTHNELAIQANSKVIKRLYDLQIKFLVEALFYDQDVFYPGHVLVRVERGIIYLMGSVTKREANKAIKQASKTRGAKKIITLFNYLKKRPQAEIDRDKKRQQKEDYQEKLRQQREKLEQEKGKIQQEINALESSDGTSL